MYISCVTKYIHKESVQNRLGAYIILTSIHAGTPHPLQDTWASPNQSVSLQALVILHMLCELAKRVPSS